MAIMSTNWDSTAVCLLAVGVYVNTLGHGFVYDDNRAILTNPDVLASSPLTEVFHNDFWGIPLSSSNSHGSYRPLCILTFRLNHWISGFQPFGFHLINVLLHGLATALVFRTARVLLPGRSPTLAASLFAVHPIHVEAVAGLAGRADVLASIFYLISFLCFVNHVKVRDNFVFSKFQLSTNDLLSKSKPPFKKGTFSKRTGENNLFLYKNYLYFHKFSVIPQGETVYFSLFLVFAVFAVLSKEPGITVIPLAVCYDIILHLRSKRTPKLISCIISSASAPLGFFIVIFLCRLYMMGLHTPSFSKADNPAAKESSVIIRILTFLYLPFFNFLMLVFPRRLSFDWSMDAIPRISTIFDYRFGFTTGFYYCLYYTLKTSFRIYRSYNFKESPKHKSCIVCKLQSGEEHLISCKTLNNNNSPIHCQCNNPSNQPLLKELTVTMCLAFVVLPFLPATNMFFYVGFVVAERVLYLPSVGFCLLVAFGFHVLWNTDRHLVTSGCLLLLVTLSARTLQRNRDWASEESLYRSAIHVNPPKAYGNLGSILSTAGRLEEAEIALRRALKYRPNMADVHYNLGNLLSRQNKLNEAVESYQFAIKYRPTLAAAYYNLGQVLEALDRLEEAELVFWKCSQLDANGLKDPRTHEEARTSCLYRLRHLCQSKQCLEATVQFLNNTVNSLEKYVTLTNIVAPRSSTETFSTKETKTSTDYIKLSSVNRTKISESEQLFLRALQKTPNDPAAYLNYGQLLVQLGKVRQAAGVYLKAAQLAPNQHALVTSAAIALRHAGRLAEAESLYRQARDLKPTDATSHSNLGAIFHLQGKYRQAASCYKEALRLAPGDQVTVTNLQKLRNLLANNKR